jgi:hypothetical protein
MDRQPKQESRQELDQRVLKRDRLFTGSAFSSEKGITEDGKIIPGVYTTATMGACRRWENDRFFPRDPINTNVEKTPYKSPNDEDVDFNQNVIHSVVTMADFIRLVKLFSLGLNISIKIIF